MLPNVKEELNTLIKQLGYWSDSYLREVTGENDDCLIDDLQNDISTWMAPYVERLTEVGHITIAEEHEFWRDISEKFNEFVSAVREGKRIEVEVKEDVEKLIAQFNLHKTLADAGRGGFEFTMKQKIKMGDVARALVPALQRKLEEVEDGN